MAGAEARVGNEGAESEDDEGGEAGEGGVLAKPPINYGAGVFHREESGQARGDADNEDDRTEDAKSFLSAGIGRDVEEDEAEGDSNRSHNVEGCGGGDVVSDPGEDGRINETGKTDGQDEQRHYESYVLHALTLVPKCVAGKGNGRLRGFFENLSKNLRVRTEEARLRGCEIGTRMGAFKAVCIPKFVKRSQCR